MSGLGLWGGESDWDGDGSGRGGSGMKGEVRREEERGREGALDGSEGVLFGEFRMGYLVFLWRGGYSRN